MALASDTTKSRSSRKQDTSGISPAPQWDPRPILPPTPDWKKERVAAEARRQLKRQRNSIEGSSASGQNEVMLYRRILPPRPKYILQNRRTRPLDSPRPPQVDDEASMHSSQPDEIITAEEPNRWSPKRLRSRSSQAGQGMYTEPDDDSIDDLDERSEENASMADDELLEEKEYDVEAIDGERIAPGVHEYWIRWVGYSERTWTASTDCFCPDLIQEMRAVQGADLSAAIYAGRVDDVDVLQQLRNAAHAKTEEDNPQRHSEPEESASTECGKSQPARFQTIVGIVNLFDSSDDKLDIKSEAELPRDARANTAWRRLGSLERDPDNESQYVTWYRSKPIDIDALITIEQQVSPKSNDELVESWRAGTGSTVMDVEDMAWNRPNTLPQRESRHQANRTDIQNSPNSSIPDCTPLPSHLSVDSSSSEVRHQRPTTTMASSVYSLGSLGFGEVPEEPTSTIACRIAEHGASGSELHSIHLFVKEAVDTGHGDLATQAIPGARSHTPIKDEADEARKMRKRNSERKLQRLLDDASIAAASAPLCSSLNQTKDASNRMVSQLSTTGSSKSAMKDLLRMMREDAARIESIKKLNLNSSRREFDSSNPRFVQDVVSHAKILASQMSVHLPDRPQQNIRARNMVPGF